MNACLNCSLLSIVMFATPANAHCYSIWRYPWKQNCNAGVAKQVNAADLKSASLSTMRVRPPPSAPLTEDDPNDHSWYVEITKLPDDIDREAGIDLLRQLMNK